MSETPKDREKPDLLSKYGSLLALLGVGGVSATGGSLIQDAIGQGGDLLQMVREAGVPALFLVALGVFVYLQRETKKAGVEARRRNEAEIKRLQAAVDAAKDKAADTGVASALLAQSAASAIEDATKSLDDLHAAAEKVAARQTLTENAILRLAEGAGLGVADAVARIFRSTDE